MKPDYSQSLLQFQVAGIQLIDHDPDSLLVQVQVVDKADVAVPLFPGKIMFLQSILHGFFRSAVFTLSVQLDQ